MRVMIIVKASKNSEAGVTPSEELVQALRTLLGSDAVRLVKAG